MNPIVDEIFKAGVVHDNEGNEYPLGSNVDVEEGTYLSDLIASDASIVKTLEVGCAYGLSALFICDALKDRAGCSHTVIDPRQMDYWHGVGIAHIERSGIDFVRFILEPSELALPDLLRSEPDSFDLVFIDGWHTFDQVLLDLYYANRLLKVGGYVVADDSNWASVASAVSYFEKYPAFEPVTSPRLEPQTWRQRVARIASAIIPAALARTVLPESVYFSIYQRMRYPSMVALKKIAADTRSYDWFGGF
jgi:predicted O-methyltransferase YrrM